MPETKTLSLPVILPSGLEECERCVNRLKDSLLQVEGVLSAEVDTDASSLTLVYDPHLSRLEDVEHRARRIGVELKQKFDHDTLTLIGLDCPDCALKLEKGVCRLRGVLWASTNFASSKLSVEYEPDKVDVASVARRVRELGYDVKESEAHMAGRPDLERAQIIRPQRARLQKQALLTGISGVALIIAGVLSSLGLTVASRVVFGISAAAGGFYAARGAVFSLRSLALDMNFLMTGAALGAIIIGEWFEAAVVMFLFSLGNALEARTVEKTRESVRSLVDLFPTRAVVLRNGTETAMEVSEVRIGDILIVRPGEKVPTDGDVVGGSSTVNEAPITGESVPVEKSVGDSVFAGAVNQRGSFEMCATATSQDNTLARIIHLVEEAQAEKSPSQRFTEVFGRYYTPAVIGLAVLVSVMLPLVTDIALRGAVYTGLTLLVVSCPCALVISTPVAIVSAIGNAARNGVLIKGGAHLEAAGDVSVVAFDKTGTITTGEAQVTDVIPADGFSKEQILSLAASVESRSEHPLAQAILGKAEQERVVVGPITDFEALTGMGAAAKFDGATCVVGNARLMEQLGIEMGPHPEVVADLQRQGKTAVLVASDGQLAGVIALMDTIRETAKDAFGELRAMGIERIVMITGDNETTARAVARDLDVDEYYAELLPQDKVDLVRLLIERHGKVAVVGDGVNDAPALAASTVGIAMGAAGSDVAMETADVALMSDDLSRLPYAIRLSRRAVTIIKQNILFSLLVIGVLIASALAGWLKLSLGVLGHEGSALIVIANGMRLLRFR